MSQEEKISRVKFWSELDDKEKVERMRGEVKRLEAVIQHQSEIIQRLLSHQHDANGKIVVILNEYGYLGGSNIPSDQSLGRLTNSSDEVYF